MHAIPAGLGTSIDLDLLSSPRWKALLSWQGEGAGAAALDPAGSGDSAAPSNTLVLGFEGEGAPVSPGVDQEMSVAAIEAAWREATPAAPAVMVPQPVPAQQEPAAPPPRPRGFGGKKRPGAAEPDEEAPPPAKQARVKGNEAAAPARAPAAASAFTPLFGAGKRLSTDDAMMLDAEAASAALDAELDGKEDLSPTDVLTGLTRVRLNSIGSPRAQRRLTAAAAAAAVTPAGRQGRLRRGDSNVPMVTPDLPGSPTGAQLLPAAPGDPGPAPSPAPGVQVQVQVMSQAATAGKLAPAPAASGAAGGRGKPAGGSGRPHMPTKSHKAVATGEGGLHLVDTPAAAGCCCREQQARLRLHAACRCSRMRPAPTPRRGRRLHLRVPRRDQAQADGAVRGALLGCLLRAPQRGEWWLCSSYPMLPAPGGCCARPPPSACWPLPGPCQAPACPQCQRRLLRMPRSPPPQKKGGRTKGRQVYLVRRPAAACRLRAAAGCLQPSAPACPMLSMWAGCYAAVPMPPVPFPSPLLF